MSNMHLTARICFGSSASHIGEGDEYRPRAANASEAAFIEDVAHASDASTARCAVRASDADHSFNAFVASEAHRDGSAYNGSLEFFVVLY